MTTQTAPLPFGDWMPDLPASSNPGALEARNVIPQANSYRSLSSLASFTNALTGPAVGSVWLLDAASDPQNFAGDSTKLYQLITGNTWTDISGPSAPYAAGYWDFAVFTGERLIAVSDGNAPQYFDVGVSATFNDLPGSPPIANKVATVRDFVMLGDIPTLGPNYVQWSGFNNSELWTPSLATQADFQELAGPSGRIQKIIGGEYGAIFTEQALWRADYVGPPIVFQFDEVERYRGTPAANSVVRSGEFIWYYGYDGFYVFDGQRSQEISTNRTSNWFARNAAIDGLDSMRGAVDRRNRLIMWAFRSSTSSPYNNRLIIYNWGADKWSYAEVDTQLLAEYVSPGFTLDQLDTPLPGGIDTDSIGVDSDVYDGGELLVVAFNTSNQMAGFTGTPLVGVIDTKELSSPDHQRVMVNSVRPMIEASGATTVTIQCGTRNRLQDNVIFDTATALNGINGEASIRKNARYHRYRVNISGGFDHGNGVKVSSRPSGGRR